jgi:hypothetical protein
MSRIGTLTGWTLAAAMAVLCSRSAGASQFLLLVLSSLVGLWLAVTVAVCAAAQHRRTVANTHPSRRHPAARGAGAAPHLRR